MEAGTYNLQRIHTLRNKSFLWFEEEQELKRLEESVSKSERPEVFPGHTVPANTLWLCTSCQTRKPWNDFHHANRTASSYMTCQACFYKHIPDVSL